MNDARIRDKLSKYKDFSKKSKSFFDGEFGNNLFKSLNETFILPELKKRKDAGKISDNYYPREILIKIIVGENPILEFDNEIKKIGTVIAAKNFDKYGENVHLQDIKGVLGVNFEGMEKVSQYFYIKKIFNNYHIISNLDTNPTDSNPVLDKETNFTHEELLGALHQLSFEEQVLSLHIRYSKELKQIGLWAIPALVPHPLNKVLSLISNEDLQGARTLVVNHCSHEFIENLSDSWWTVTQFRERKSAIIEAIDAHKRGKYHLVIPALLPHIEGIITDWLYDTQGSIREFKQVSKTKKFFSTIKDKNIDENSFSIIVQSCANFILEGPVLETFNNWQLKVKNTFTNRHVIEHGKYDDSLYTEENSIKLFLLLDTIFYIINQNMNP